MPRPLEFYTQKPAGRKAFPQGKANLRGVGGFASIFTTLEL